MTDGGRGFPGGEGKEDVPAIVGAAEELAFIFRERGGRGLRGGHGKGSHGGKGGAASERLRGRGDGPGLLLRDGVLEMRGIPVPAGAVFKDEPGKLAAEGAALAAGLLPGTVEKAGGNGDGDVTHGIYKGKTRVLNTIKYTSEIKVDNTKD